MDLVQPVHKGTNRKRIRQRVNIVVLALDVVELVNLAGVIVVVIIVEQVLLLSIVNLVLQHARII